MQELKTINIELQDKHAEKSLKASAKECEKIDEYINDNIVNIKGVGFSPQNIRLESMKQLNNTLKDGTRLKHEFERRQKGTAYRLVNAFLKESVTEQ